MSQIKVLGISGTPVKDGNCDAMVKVSLEAAEELEGVETEFITMADKEVTYCKHCQYCVENKEYCKIKDDAQYIWERISNADALIVGAPTWLRTVSVPIMNLFSRCRYMIFYSHEWRNMAAGILTVGWFGTGMDLALHSMDVMVRRFGMLPIAHGSAVSSAMAQGQRATYMERGVIDDKRGMMLVRNVGWRVTEIARMIKFAEEQGVGVPPEYQVTATGATVKRRPKK